MKNEKTIDSKAKFTVALLLTALVGLGIGRYMAYHRDSALPKTAAQEASLAIDDGFDRFENLDLMQALRSSDQTIKPSTFALLNHVESTFQWITTESRQPERPSLHDKNLKNNEASVDVLEGLQNVATDVATLKRQPALNGRKLRAEFSEALNLYRTALAQKDFQEDEAGNAQLAIAYKKFLHVLVSDPHNAARSSILYLLGDIGARLWVEGKGLAGSVYLIEVIRTYSGEEIAQKAWLKLYAEIRFWYTGSGGDNTPGSWRTLLTDLRSLALGSEADGLASLGLGHEARWASIAIFE